MDGTIPQVEVGYQRAVLSDRQYPSVRQLITEAKIQGHGVQVNDGTHELSGNDGDLQQVKVDEKRAVLSDRRYPYVRDKLASAEKKNTN